MSVLATDDFNRANAPTPGANWSGGAAFSQLSIVSNAAEAATGGAFNVSFYSAISFPDDQYSQAVALTIQDAAVVVRHAGIASTFYMFYRGASNLFIFKCLGGSFTQLADFGAGGVNNDLMRLEAHGSTLQGFLNGSQFGSDVTDFSIASGSAGILGYDPSNSRLDDWEGGDFAIASTVHQLSSLGVG